MRLAAAGDGNPLGTHVHALVLARSLCSSALHLANELCLRAAEVDLSELPERNALFRFRLQREEKGQQRGRGQEKRRVC